MWTSTQTIKIRVQQHHSVFFFSCKEVGIFFRRISSKTAIKQLLQLVIEITNSTVLNKLQLQSYSETSALCPEGHCTSRFKRAMCISCRPHVDVHGTCCRLWTGGGGQNLIFLWTA